MIFHEELYNTQFYLDEIAKYKKSLWSGLIPKMLYALVPGILITGMNRHFYASSILFLTILIEIIVLITHFYELNKKVEIAEVKVDDTIRTVVSRRSNGRNRSYVKYFCIENGEKYRINADVFARMKKGKTYLCFVQNRVIVKLVKVLKEA